MSNSNDMKSGDILKEEFKKKEKKKPERYC